MGWVVKKPKRPDFCGCPPCPLCFDWATEPPAGRVQDKWVQEIIAGFTKFSDDMLDGKTPTAAEKETLEKAAEAIHVANLGASERLDEEIRAADRQQHLERQIGQYAKSAAQGKDYAPPSAPALDDMDIDWKEVEKQAEEAERRKNEPPKKPQEFVWPSYDRDSVGIYSYIDQMQKTLYGEMFKSVFVGIDTAATTSAETKQQLTEKQLRENQATEDAKKRMKAQARQEIRR